MDCGSAIFLRNWAALKAKEERVQSLFLSAAQPQGLFCPATSCRPSGRSWRCTSCSSARPEPQTCWWTCPEWAGRLRTQSPSSSQRGTDAWPRCRSVLWLSAAARKKKGLIFWNSLNVRGQSKRLPARIYLEVHKLHELGHFRLQHFHRLLVDLHSVGLLVAFHLMNTRGCSCTDSSICT